ncbi:DegV family protein [Caldalkalibacillus mannanilyticus]|uniref:DegV family protein n=1 Tax=Caldalkalibacillus mannanilyticus TaxID=1418 RepID=UPI000468CFA8|nr:DegV family protein [Caldalkalibacillus mannanilyticus]
MGVVFILDSGSDFEVENQIQVKHPVEVIPLNIHIDEHVYLDGVDINKTQFYEKMAASQALPKTSQPSPQAFYEVFKKYIEQGNHIISISIASELSGTFQSSSIAQNMLSDEEQNKVFLIDSKNVSVAILYMVKVADQLLSEGVAVEEVVRRLEEMKDNIKIFALLDTLENLKKGGRISQTQAFIGELLNIKPMVCVEYGKVENLGKFRGRKKGLKELSSTLSSAAPYDTDYLFIVHSFDTYEEAEEEAKAVLDPEQFMHTYFYKLGSTIGTHAGKNTLGICVLKK